MKVGKAVLTSCLLILVSWSAAASGATSPLKGTQELLAVVQAGTSKKQQQSAMKKVRTYFDYELLVENTIEPHRKKLNAKQLERYSKTFRQLLEMAPFIASIGENDKLEYKISKPVRQNGGVLIGLQAYDAKTDMDTDIAFEWREQNGAWLVVDVSLDGVSMIKGYQNQFGRILKKEGAEGLIARLEKRLTEVKAEADAGS